MVDVPAARAMGFRLVLHEGPMHALLNSEFTHLVLANHEADVAEKIRTHVRAVASPVHAENYSDALITARVDSDQLGMDFSGKYALGNRPVSIVGLPSGRGPNPKAKPPLMVEAETHALTSVPGFRVGKTGEVTI